MPGNPYVHPRVQVQTVESSWTTYNGAGSMGVVGSGCTHGPNEIKYNCDQAKSYDIKITVRKGEVWFGTQGCGQLHVMDAVGKGPFYVYLGSNNDGGTKQVQWDSLKIDAYSSLSGTPETDDGPATQPSASPAPTVAWDPSGSDVPSPMCSTQGRA